MIKKFVFQIYIVNKNVRNVSSSSNLYIRSKKNETGMTRFINEMNIPKEKLIDDPEGFGDTESDFLNAHLSHKDYIEELKSSQNYLRLKIVGDKYFKKKYPNFLTFNEKEQIRYLHTKDPEEWTVEKLEESFPASSEIIIKILKAKWYPRNSKRLQKHDEKVIENWEKLKKGEFELPIEYETHLKKFAGRNLSILKNIDSINKWVEAPSKLPKPSTKEFLSIVSNSETGNQKLTSSKENYQIQLKNDKRPGVKYLNFNKDYNKKENFVIGGTSAYQKSIVLENLKEKVIKIQSNNDKNLVLASTIKDISQDEKDIQKMLPNESKINKFSSYKEVDISKSKIFNSTLVKDRIHIPKKLWKKDATYKMNDCYYDFDGKLLYRVPGMGGNNIKNN